MYCFFLPKLTILPPPQLSLWPELDATPDLLAKGGGNEPFGVGLQVDLVDHAVRQQGKHFLKSFPAQPATFQGRAVLYCLRETLRIAQGLFCVMLFRRCQ